MTLTKGTETQFDHNANAGSPQAQEVIVPSGVEALIVIVTIWDTSSSDGVVSGVTFNGSEVFSEEILAFDSGTGAHLSIWLLLAPTATTADVSVAFGGTVSDFKATVVEVQSTVGTVAVDSTGALNTGNGDPTISWTTIDADTITFAAALDDQQVGSRVTVVTGNDLYIVDIGADTVMASYLIHTSAGSKTHDWDDSDQDEDFAVIGLALFESLGSTFEEDIVLARGQNTVVPVADLIRVGTLTLARGQNTLVPVADLTRVGALLLSRGQNTIVLLGNIDTPQSISLGKDLGSAWIGNIITPQALALAITNRTITFEAGLLYATTVTLARGQNTLVPSATLTREGALSLGKDKGISFVSQLDAVGVLSLGKDLGITIAGNILTPQAVTLGDKDLGVTLDGNIITPQSLSLGKDKGLSFLGGVGFAVALSLAKDAGITLSASLTRVGALSLNKDAGIAITNLLTAVGALSLNNVRVIALNGSIVTPVSLTLAKDLGIAESAQVDFNAVLSLAKFVAFIPTATVITPITPPTATGDITLIEDVTGILEIVEQATGNIVLIETPTGTLILDLTP